MSDFTPKAKTVVVVSAFGRGHWMAVELKRAGLQVHLLDMSEGLCSWVPEDAEGPFGYFQPERFGSSMLERLNEDDHLQQVENGFTLLLSSGPVELRGPVANHRLKKIKFSEDWWKSTAPPADSFESSWLWHLSAGVAQNQFKENNEGYKNKFSLPLTVPFFVKKPTRQGHHQSLQWVERSGVSVYRRVQIFDIALNAKKNIRGVEILKEGSKSSEILDGEQFIWCLSSEETDLLGVRVRQSLFPNGALEPEWIWQRYRLKIGESVERNIWPEHFLMLQDVGLPWAHENLLIVHRTTSDELFDVWTLLPNAQRFNRDYLTHRSEKMIQLFKQRWVHMKVDVNEYPEGYELTYNKVGPARQPVFNSNQWKSWKFSNYKNFHLDSFESRPGLGSEGAWTCESNIISELKKWWTADQAIQEKEHLKRIQK